MSLEVVVLKQLPNAQQFYLALQKVTKKAFAGTAARIAALAPKGKTGKLSRRVDVLVKPSGAAGVFGNGLEVDFVTGAPYGHLVERGHKIVARGAQRKGLKLSKDERRARRVALLSRRGAPSGFVPGQHFALNAFTQNRAQAVAQIEAGLKQELDR